MLVYIFFCLQISPLASLGRNDMGTLNPDDNSVISSNSSSVISSDRRESRNLNHANITNIPDPGHKKGLFSGRRSHFPIRGQENGRFSGPPVQPSVPIKEKPPQNAVARLWGSEPTPSLKRKRKNRLSNKNCHSYRNLLYNFWSNLHNKEISYSF